MRVSGQQDLPAGLTLLMYNLPDDRLPGGAGLRAMLNSAEQAWLAEGGAESAATQQSLRSCMNQFLISKHVQ